MLTEDELAVVQSAARAEKAGAEQPLGLLDGGPSGTSEITGSRSGLNSQRSRGRLNRQQKQALAELKHSALVLLADGVDIGDMRLSDLLEVQPTHQNPLRKVGMQPAAKNPQQIRRIANTNLQVANAYEQALPLPHIHSKGKGRSSQGRLSTRSREY